MTGEMLAVDPEVDATCRFNFNATIPEVPERVVGSAFNTRMTARGDGDRSGVVAGTTAYDPDAHVLGGVAEQWLCRSFVDV